MIPRRSFAPAAAIAFSIALVPFTTALAPAVAAVPHAASHVGAVPGTMVYLKAGPKLAKPVGTAVETPQEKAAPATSTFQVTYTGFPAPAQAAFQRAINRWSTLVSSSVPILVNATWEPLEPGVLGGASPDQLYFDFPNAPVAQTYYASALANKLAGSDIEPTRPDIDASFASNVDSWWFGTAAAPAGMTDFESVVMHEIGHGLGFIGAGFVSDGRGSITNGLHTAYDLNTERGGGRLLTSYPDPSVGLATALTSNALYFDSPQVRAATNGNRAKLYAPSTFEPGSSYIHLDEDHYPAGTRNSLMTPALAGGETIRTPGPIALAIFATEGW